MTKMFACSARFTNSYKTLGLLWSSWERFCAWCDREPERMMRLLLPVGVILWIVSSAVHLAWSVVEDVQRRRRGP